MENVQSKKCCSCGRILPVTSFHKRAKSNDGLQSICKECKKKIARDRYVQVKEKNLQEIECNPLRAYTPRQLLSELKRRGYKWERMFVTQEVKYETI